MTDMEREMRTAVNEAAIHRLTHKRTNADRIRAMSDEELTRKMTDGNGFFGCPQCSQGACRKCDLECGKHCLEWLQQPAEED